MIEKNPFPPEDELLLQEEELLYEEDEEELLYEDDEEELLYEEEEPDPKYLSLFALVFSTKYVS